MSSTAIVPVTPNVQTVQPPKRFKRFSLGAILGGLLGACAGGPPGLALGLVIGGGVGAATGGGKASSAAFAGSIAANHVKVFREAMNSTREPEELRELADAFDKHGHKQFATVLRRRAATRDLPDDQKRERRSAFRAAMASDDPRRIVSLAAAFEGEGSFGAANDLYDHARAVRAAHTAGARAQPLADPRIVEQLGDRLGKAIIHYGADSMQARTAAANFLRARGVQPSEAAVKDIIAAAHTEVAAPETPLPEASPAIEATPAEEAPIIDVPGTQTSTVVQATQPTQAGEGDQGP